MTRTIQRTSCPHRSAQKIMPLSDKAARCHAASVQGGHNGRPARSPRPRHRPFSNLRMLESSPVLSFLSGKEKKEPKKRNLNGKGDERGPAGGPPRGVRFLFSGEGVARSPSSHPHHPLPIFPCGAFLKEKPRKIIFADNDSAADGRAQRQYPGRVPGFLFWFSFRLLERKENIKNPPKEQPPWWGGCSGRRGARVSALWCGSPRGASRRRRRASSCRGRRRAASGRRRGLRRPPYRRARAYRAPSAPAPRGS